MASALRVGRVCARPWETRRTSRESRIKGLQDVLVVGVPFLTYFHHVFQPRRPPLLVLDSRRLAYRVRPSDNQGASVMWFHLHTNIDACFQFLNIKSNIGYDKYAYSYCDQSKTNA